MSFVLDSSAILALLWNETGSDSVIAALPGATVSSVNLAEVVSKLTDRGIAEEPAWTLIDDLAINVTAFDRDQAFKAGRLRGSTRHLGLSIGDRACLSLGLLMQVPILTADKTWMELDIGLDIRCIR